MKQHRILVIGVLATCLAGALLLVACSSNNNQATPEEGSSDNSLAVAKPETPTRISKDDTEAWLKVMDNNPLNYDFLDSLSDFSYKTAAASLTNGASSEGAGASSNGTYSPISLYYALALATQGAAGETAADMNALLNAPDAAKIPQESGNLFRVLSSDPYTDISLANSIWLSDRDQFKQSFIDVATQQFYATPFSVQFGTPQTDAAMGAWIKENTGGTLDPQVETSADQLLSIINTVYFKDGWAAPFPTENTYEGVFRAKTGDVNTSFMTQRFSTPADYAQTAQYTRASLAFGGGSTLSFVLPVEGVTPQDILGDTALLKEAFTSTPTDLANITFTVPKLSFDTSFDLIPPLKSLGLTTPFTDQADFSNLTDTPAYISYIKQESHLAWDENGAEASAYTNIGISKMAIAPDATKELDFKLDRPFLFEIKSAHGVPLFIGVCENPTL